LDVLIARPILKILDISAIEQSKNSYSAEVDMQHIEDSKEDSPGDGLVLFDDPLFPELSNE
jgi:hypothetical protein